MCVEQPNFGCYSKLGCRQWWNTVTNFTISYVIYITSITGSDTDIVVMWL